MPRYYGNDDDIQQSNQGQELLGAGWRPLYRQLDWMFLGQLVANDPWEIVQKSLSAASTVANALGRANYAWWANILHVFSDDTRYYLDEFWDYITPAPPSPDYSYSTILSTETPITRTISRDSIPIEYVLSRLQERTVLTILDLLGQPSLITQSYLERHFYYPVTRFTTWERVRSVGTILAYWSEQQAWLQIYNSDRGRRRYTVICKDLIPLVQKATSGVAVMLSGYQSRVGKVQSYHPLTSFPDDIQGFTDRVQQSILTQPQVAVLVNGEPGTGKTAWAQAIAAEVLAPLGYVIFILDHDAVENFVPPTYLERIGLIINEADNLAQNRASRAAQGNNRTEHILSLLDGTLYQSVVDESGVQADQKLVVLMTCNTTERLDPAMLRKGRIDLTYEFTYRFV